MPGFPAPEALLLDLDGTLIDTHELIWTCYSRVLEAQVPGPACRNLWLRSMGLPLGDIFAAALAECGRTDLAPEALVTRYRELQPELDHTLQPFPGVEATLDELRRRGVRLAVVTTKHSRLALRHMEMLDLTSRFEAIVTGDQCARCKPDPEPFLTALRLLNVPPHRAYGVGDTTHDIAASRGAGLRTVGAAWGTLDRVGLEAAQPELLLEAPEELLRIGA